MSGLANETAAYALLSRTLRASYADCSINHTFLDPLYLPLCFVVGAIETSTWQFKHV